MSITGFSGLFAISNWTFTINQGNILTNNAPTSVTLVSGNSGIRGSATMSIRITSPGSISFSYNASTADVDLVWDPFGYLINSSKIFLANSGRNKTGTLTVNVSANDVFGFFVDTIDGIFGSSTTIVNNFIFTGSQVAPTIQPLILPTTTFGDPPFTLTAPVSNSSGAFSYTSSDTNVATISGSIVTIVNAGSSVITANQAATSNFSAGSVNATLFVSKANPTYQPWPTITKTYGDTPFTLTAPISNSPGAFTYGSSNAAVATIDGITITINGAGVTTIAAIQAETSNYLVGYVTTTLTVFKANPVIQPWPPISKIYGDPPFTLSQPQSNSDGEFNYTINNTFIGTIDGNIVTINNAGITILNAIQSPTTNFNQGTVSTLFFVSKGTPVIQPWILPPKTYEDAPFTINQPISTSDGTFTYTSSDIFVAYFIDSICTIISAGSTLITANQEATVNYFPASTTAMLYVSKADPDLQDFTIPPKEFGDPPFELSPPESNNTTSPFIYTIVDQIMESRDEQVVKEDSESKVATISGSTVTIIGTGIAIIKATQEGNSDYDSASINGILSVSKGNPIIEEWSIPSKTFGDPPFQLTQPVSNSDGKFLYTSSDTDVATILGSIVTIKHVGETLITADQEPTPDFNAGTVTAPLIVSKATPYFESIIVSDVKVKGVDCKLYKISFKDIKSIVFYKMWNDIYTDFYAERIVTNTTTREWIHLFNQKQNQITPTVIMENGCNKWAFVLQKVECKGNKMYWLVNTTNIVNDSKNININIHPGSFQDYNFYISAQTYVQKPNYSIFNKPLFNQIISGDIFILNTSNNKYKLLFKNIDNIILYQTYYINNQERLIFNINQEYWLNIFNYNSPLQPTVILEKDNCRTCFIITKAIIKYGKLILNITTNDIKNISTSICHSIKTGYFKNTKLFIDPLLITYKK